MASSLGTENGKKSVNIDLNIIPFIDLMSCLTAFLLVTAVWVNIAGLEIKPAGLKRDQIIEPPPDPKLSVLIEADDIWIGVSRVDDFERIPRTGDGYDWTKFEATLREHKISGFFADKHDIEIAAAGSSAHVVSYQSLVIAMDLAVKVGFSDVGVVDPASLSARPSL